LEQTIAGVDADRLREDDIKREDVKAKVDDILKAFDF
jgi:hypothetical protein